MRRALLREWPAITRFYGIRPWELELLTVDELHEYITQRRDVVREQAAATAAAQQRRRR